MFRPRVRNLAVKYGNVGAGAAHSGAVTRAAHHYQVHPSSLSDGRVHPDPPSVHGNEPARSGPAVTDTVQTRSVAQRRKIGPPQSAISLSAARWTDHSPKRIRTEQWPTFHPWVGTVRRVERVRVAWLLLRLVKLYIHIGLPDRTYYLRESEGICFHRRWFVCVCLSVTTITKKLWTDLHQILCEGP